MTEHTYQIFDYGREARFSCGVKIHFTCDRSMLEEIVCPQHLEVARRQHQNVDE
jgi:hypothetical protein